MPLTQKALSAQCAAQNPHCIWEGQTYPGRGSSGRGWAITRKRHLQGPPRWPGESSRRGFPQRTSCLELVGPPPLSPRCCESQRDFLPSHGPAPGSGKPSVGEAEVGDVEGGPSRLPEPPRALGQDRREEACRPSALVPQSPTRHARQALHCSRLISMGISPGTEGGWEEQGQPCCAGP